MNRLEIAVVCLLCVVIFGITGFMLIEHLSLIDAVYLTVVTVSTVGFGDIVPATISGKIFTATLIVFGVGTAAYTFTLIFSLIVEGNIRDHFGRRTMLREITNLNQHVIVCGAGRVGKEVIAGLQKNGKPCVVIESDPVKVESLLEDKIMAICGDAKLDKTLQGAGVKKASFLIAALSNDADNVYVTLSAKNQNRDIAIISRAEDEEAEIKMRQAGATTVISPSISGGRQMLAAIRHPIAYDFLEYMFFNQGIHYDLVEVSIGPESTLIGKTPNEVWKKYFLKLLITAIKRDDQFLSANIDDERIRSGDLLIVVGRIESIQILEQLACSAVSTDDLSLESEKNVTG
ncbi:ion channel [Lucifera butyrica]|uniref:Ion channel n=1 Tax=Lucifera butyrica TaxID=1351585 RepID=A0A498RDC7_9FIRM|nr:potassium channel protein [Lucifera butyrica]VBB07198.1 ion channel [Lucifera butyrica]